VEFTVEALARRVREGLEVPGPVSDDDSLAPPAPRSALVSSATPSAVTRDALGAMYARLTGALREAELYVGVDDLVFLVAAYDAVLGREPDTPGFLGFARRLQRGDTRLHIVIGLARSDEFRVRHARAALHARFPLLLLWKTRAAMPGHWMLLASSIGSDTGPVVITGDGTDDAVRSMEARVVELQARHWEIVNLVREANGAVLERLERALFTGTSR
jgi:hypothetical protein